MLNTSKLSSYLLYALMTLSVLIIVLYGFDSIEEGTMLVWTYILFAIASISAILFPIAYFIANPKKAKNALIGIGAFVVIGLLSYLLADSTIPTFIGSETFNITESLSKNIGTGLWATYLLAGLTLGAILYSEIIKYFK